MKIFYSKAGPVLLFAHEFKWILQKIRPRHRGEAALRKHLREHDQKAALSSEIRKRGNTPRISKNSASCRIRICELANLSLTH